MFPATITFVSDENELVLIKKITHDLKGKKLLEEQAVYEYTKSKNKMGTEVSFTLSQIEKLKSNQLLK